MNKKVLLLVFTSDFFERVLQPKCVEMLENELSTPMKYFIFAQQKQKAN